MILSRNAPPARPDRRWALAAVCALFVGGCQTDLIALSPPMHARVLDGVTKKPLGGVQVRLVSSDTPQEVVGTSDPSGFVDMPGLMGEDNFVVRHMTDTPHTAVHAVFRRPGYETYTIDSINGYGFFRGYEDVHLYPAFRSGD